MIQFFKPTIRRKDMDSVLQSLVNEQLGPGERASSFMQEFSQKTKCRTSAAFRTYPQCIESAFLLLGAVEGTKVAISPLAPVVYLEVMKKLGCIPVYLDVDPETGLVPSGTEFGDATILVLYENCGSLPVKYNSSTTYAEKQEYANISVIEDVSQSIGGFCDQEAAAGDWGHIVICSCEQEDLVSCAGGAVMGVKGDLLYTLRGRRPSSYNSMTDVNAALGFIQLQNLAENCVRRREIKAKYIESLMRTRHRAFGANFKGFDDSASCFPVFLDCKPEDVVKFAAKNNVPVRMTFENSIAASYEGDMFVDFPVAAAYCSRTVSFPVYPFLQNEDISLISKVVAHLP